MEEIDVSARKRSSMLLNERMRFETEKQNKLLNELLEAANAKIAAQETITASLFLATQERPQEPLDQDQVILVEIPLALCAQDADFYEKSVRLAVLIQSVPELAQKVRVQWRKA